MFMHLPFLGVQFCTVRKLWLGEDSHPFWSSDGTVLGLVFIAVRAGVLGIEALFLFDQTGGPAFGVEDAFVPRGISPDGLAPVTPWSGKPDLIGDW